MVPFQSQCQQFQQSHKRLPRAVTPNNLLSCSGEFYPRSYDCQRARHSKPVHSTNQSSIFRRGTCVFFFNKFSNIPLNPICYFSSNYIAKTKCTYSNSRTHGNSASFILIYNPNVYIQQTTERLDDEPINMSSPHKLCQSLRIFLSPSISKIKPRKKKGKSNLLDSFDHRVR